MNLTEARAAAFDDIWEQEQERLRLAEQRRLEEAARKVTEESLSRDLDRELDQAERKAVDALARYKFAMFGYWAGIWVHLNRISGQKRPNPFWCFVNCARCLKGN